MVLKVVWKSGGLVFILLLFICISAFTVRASSVRLSPSSFEQMYNMAASGNTRALSMAIYRGLNINAVNAEGDSGICVAVKKRDVTAYNTFCLVGANPNHPCTLNIPYYQSFVNSKAVQEGSVWKSTDYVPPVYNMEQSTQKYWGIAGIILALGAVAFLLL